MRTSRVAARRRFLNRPPASRAGLAALVAGATLAVAACGGGGDSSAASRSRPSEVAFSSSVPRQATARVLAANAEVADALVALANQGAENWAAAQAVSASMLGAGALNVSALSGTGQGDGDSTALCGSGSVAVQADDAFIARILRSKGTDWQADDRVDFEFRQCVIDDGSLGLAQLPDGAKLNGGVQLAVARYSSASNYAATLTLSNFRMTSPGGATTLALNQARFAVDYTPRAMHTMLDTGTQAYIDGQVSVLGQIVLVSAGIWRITPPARLSAISGWLDLDYSGWRFDRALQRGQAGNVQVQGNAGPVGTITAGADGGYTVSLVATPGNPPVVFDCAAQQACVLSQP